MELLSNPFPAQLVPGIPILGKRQIPLSCLAPVRSWFLLEIAEVIQFIYQVLRYLSCLIEQVQVCRIANCLFGNGGINQQFASILHGLRLVREGRCFTFPLLLNSTQDRLLKR